MQRLRYPEIPSITGAGVYAFSIDDPAALSSIRVGSTGLLYVGMSESSLEIRNHFFHKDSSFSSLRRSFGALLRDKDDLNLHAIPRGSGQSAKDLVHYRFRGDGCRAALKTENVGNGVGLLHLNRFFRTFGADKRRSPLLSIICTI
jgi:hypothetical protein